MSPGLYFLTAFAAKFIVSRSASMPGVGENVNPVTFAHGECVGGFLQHAVMVTLPETPLNVYVQVPSGSGVISTNVVPGGLIMSSTVHPDVPLTVSEDPMTSP